MKLKVIIVAVIVSLAVLFSFTLCDTGDPKPEEPGLPSYVGEWVYIEEPLDYVGFWDYEGGEAGSWHLYISREGLELINASDGEDESTYVFGIRALTEVVEEVSGYTVILTIASIFDVFGAGDWIYEGHDNWESLYDPIIVAFGLEWTFDVGEDTLTVPILGTPIPFSRGLDDPPDTGTKYIMTLTENSYELIMRDLETSMVELGFRGSFEVSGITGTIILTEIYFPGFLWIVEGDPYWDYYLDYFSPYFISTGTYSVEGDQLTTINQILSDFSNELIEITWVFTRQ